MNKEYYNFIRRKGYVYSKDNMGYYFDLDDTKFSIIKNGPYMQCFYNKKINNSWKLQSCSQHMIDIDKCFLWIINIINESNK